MKKFRSRKAPVFLPLIKFYTERQDVAPAPRQKKGTAKMPCHTFFFCSHNNSSNDVIYLSTDFFISSVSPSDDAS